jgi:hypothetical protein
VVTGSVCIEGKVFEIVAKTHQAVIPGREADPESRAAKNAIGRVDNLRMARLWIPGSAAQPRNDGQMERAWFFPLTLGKASPTCIPPFIVKR